MPLRISQNCLFNHNWSSSPVHVCDCVLAINTSVRWEEFRPESAWALSSRSIWYASLKCPVVSVTLVKGDARSGFTDGEFPCLILWNSLINVSVIFKREIRQARILDAQIRRTKATDFSVFPVLVLIFYVEGAKSALLKTETELMEKFERKSLPGPHLKNLFHNSSAE